MRDDQTVAGMANEVLMCQAKARADRNGEPIEAAMSAVVGTEAGRQLAGLRDGPHGEEGVEEWQVGIAQERARPCFEDREEPHSGSDRPDPHVGYVVKKPASTQPRQNA